MNKCNNVICFDFGTKKIGIAIGNNIICIPHPMCTLNLKNKNIFWKKLKNIIKNWSINTFIIGFPYSNKYNNLIIINNIKIFYNELINKYNNVFLQNESFTTSEARLLIKNSFLYKKNSKNKKKNIHSLSACIILNDWFENKKYNI